MKAMEGSIWSRVQSSVTGKAREFVESHEDLVIGLDFGTSNSCVSIWRKDKHRVKIVKNTRDEKITPSAIHFYNNFENYHVGTVPHDDNTSYCTIQGVKSLLGATKLEDVPSYFTHKCSIEDRPDESDKQLIITVVDPTSGEEKQYTCEELIALIISYLRLSVFQYLKRKPIQKKKVDYDLQRVVIGVPAHFPEKKREALRAAAIMGGFEEVHFMIESTAAAMAYGLLVAGEKFVLVFDMGGGTTDLTVLYINNGRYDIQYTYGQSRLGGQDIDSILVQQMIQIITADLIYWEVTLPKEELLMTKNQQFIQKLYELCKECKEQLSTNSEHVFNYYGLLLLLKDNYQTVNQLIQSLEEKKNEKINKRKMNQESSFEFTVTRKQFEKWISPVLDRIEQTVLHTLQQYKEKKQEEDKSGELFEETKDFAISIDEVVLVGGSSQIPSIQSTLRKACGTMGVHHFAVRNEFSSMIDEVDDDKEGEQSKDNDESPQTLVGKEFCVSINPNYAVVEGLAIRGAIIAGEDSTMLKDILMMDCLPMTLGLLLFSDNNDKYFEPIIYQGSKLPIEQRKRISIADRNQKFVTLEIYEEIEEILEANKMKYSYYLLVTCDALIENLEDDLPPDESRLVEVVFRVEEDSHLSYKVVEVRENKSSSANEVKSNKKKVDHSSQQMMLLVVYSCFLLLVYVGMKFLFSNTSQYTEEVVEIKSE